MCMYYVLYHCTVLFAYCLLGYSSITGVCMYVTYHCPKCLFDDFVLVVA